MASSPPVIHTVGDPPLPPDDPSSIATVAAPPLTSYVPVAVRLSTTVFVPPIPL
ncbi:hypothetical protein [Fimbriiglobus ruber]|uniref:hypothetical protein n=1 Tax=Fimbriiglobus ruber TaxID=1908690 RepID=UPI001379A1C6|nr:hypothetical protein [Fimbriiglobus ruber]